MNRYYQFTDTKFHVKPCQWVPFMPNNSALYCKFCWTMQWCSPSDRTQNTNTRKRGVTELQFCPPRYEGALYKSAFGPIGPLTNMDNDDEEKNMKTDTTTPHLDSLTCFK